MKHETPTVAAEPRDRRGSRYAQRLRKAGRLPGVIYGHKKDPVAVSVDRTEMIDHIRHGAHLLTIKLPDKQETCIVKDLQFGYLGDDVIHIDFARVNLSEEVEVSVHLEFVGEPKAAAQAGAILTHRLTMLEVRCRADAIPGSLPVDLSDMGDTLSVAEITLPAGLVAVGDPDEIVCQISHVHEIEDAEAVEVADTSAEPEVIGGTAAEAESATEPTES